MFIGEYKHIMDEKRRVSLPSKMRKECETDLVMTKGFDECIFIYSKSVWKNMMEKLNDLSLGQHKTRDLARYFFASAEEVSIDASGRILIPEKLFHFGNLSKDTVTIIGSGNRIEFWNENNWELYQKNSLSQIDEIAQSLGELGLI